MRHNHFSLTSQAGAITLMVAGFTSIALAKDTPAAKNLPAMSIIGDPSAIFTLPGSAHYIDFKSLKESSYDDINQVLRRIPGVYMRQEDAYGQFPNISLRGVDSSRSAKVTLMEDGILAAPAPYASPSAYYSPTIGRMHSLEILKGSSQIKYGPRTTGGAINYISTPIPEEERLYLRGMYGAYDDWRTHGIYGNTIDTDHGRFGFVVEGYFRGTDGFNTIDSAPGFTNTDETGFTNIEPMIKLSWEPMTDMYQRFEFRYGYSQRDADISYLGLTTEDFRNDPFRRYSASRFDNIDREQHRTYLRHVISPTDNFDLTTTAYYNQFRRDWYKLQDIRNVGGLGNLGLSSALAGTSAGGFAGDGLACLKGNLDCVLRVRANNREMFAWGVQSEGTLRFETASLDHELTIGVRYHNDEEDRFQHDDLFTQNNVGAITGVTRGTPGSQADREIEAKAVAVYVQDRIEIGDFWFTPGFRYEHVNMEVRNYGSNEFGEADLDLFGGGIGAGYNITDEWQTFGGVHFGFSPPDPTGAVAGLEEETSIGFEIGARYASRDQVLSAEVVGFYTQFDDLIVVNNIGGTGTGVNENFGEVDSAGVELSARYDLGLANNWSFSNPYTLAFTYTHAEQQNDARSTSASSIFSYGQKGNKVPYIPEYMLNAGTALEFSNWGVAVNVSYVSETFTSANNVGDEINGVGTPDARFGKTDDYTIVDLETHYNVRQGIKLFAGVHNLFEEEYLASRQPHGPRPGAPRMWYTGIEFEL